MSGDGVSRLNNLFAGIPVKLPLELVDVLASAEGVKIERIVSRGHTSPQQGWYDQEQNEWVMVVQGKGIIAYPDRDSITLEAGDYVTIAAHQKHRVAWTSPDEDTLWLAVHY